MTIHASIQKFLEFARRSPWLCLITAAILLAGCFFRFHYLGSIYTDYDDVGVIGVYKSVTPGKRTRSILSTPVIEFQATVDTETFGKHLLDTPLFPFYIGKTWTYPIGQYLVYPLLINESDGYFRKLALGRSVSALASCLALVLLLYHLYQLDGRRFTWRLLPPLCLLAFSFNSVLYAHHMSPYSTAVATLIASSIFFYEVLEQRLSFRRFAVWLGVLTVFNYLILITIPLYGMLYIAHAGLLRDSWSRTSREWLRVLQGVAAYVVIVAPFLVLFFKPGAGTRGDMPPSPRDGIAAYVWHFVMGTATSAGSAVASFDQNDTFNAALAMSILLGGTALLVARFSRLGREKYVCVFSALFVVQWVVLHGLGKILLGPSRHVIVWLPFVAVLAHLILKWANPRPWLLAAMSLVMLILGSVHNEHILRSKLNQFDFAAIERENAGVVLMYSGTFAPAVYFDGRKRCWLLEHRCFAKDYDELQLPERMLLVSQACSLSDYAQSPEFTENRRLFEDYEATMIREATSTTSFTFNNKGTYSSLPNGFFLYELRRREAAGVATARTPTAR